MPEDHPVPTDHRMDRVVASILDAAHQMPPDRLPTLIADGAATLGASSSRMWLADAQKRTLVHLTVDTDADTQALDGSAAGRAFVTSDNVELDSPDGGCHLFVPLLDGVDCLGVLELQLDMVVTVPLRNAFRHLASIAAAELITRGQYTDLFLRTRRVRPMSLAAELQWQALPPQSFATHDVSVAGMLEPAYETGGDSFDYAHGPTGLSLAVLDAVGHDLRSSIISMLALGAYRNQRREGGDLIAAASAMDAVIRNEIGTAHYATGQLGELDTKNGVLRWLNAGHPLPLLIRGGSVIMELPCRPRLPFGLGYIQAGRVPEIAEVQLQPGDAILFYSDGITEARRPGGKDFGVDRLEDFLHRAFSAGLAPTETVRRLSRDVVDYQGGKLHDDATTLLLVWHPHGSAST
jgi:serine phosphatase RsbU (regulator of sigma subunit)